MKTSTRLAFGSVASASSGTPGLAMSWGANVWNALGDPAVPSALVLDPHQVGSEGDWASVATASTDVGAAEMMETFAIKTDGTLWSWGEQLGRPAR